jgi:hypothetical protein
VTERVRKPTEDEDRLCARVKAELREQRLPLVLDATAVGRIAALLGGEDERKRERRLDMIQQQLAELEVRWKPGGRQEL